MRSRPTLLLCLTTLTLATGCRDARSPEEQLVSRLQQQPLLRVHASGGSVGWGAPNARAYARQLRDDGVDLFRAYELAADHAEARFSLAYLLLLDEDPAYLRFAEAHADKWHAGGDWLVWIVAARATDVTDGHRAAICGQLATLDEPAARVAVAAHRLARQETAPAVADLLSLMSAAPLDAAAARSVLTDYAGSHGGDMLLPYLDEPTTGGVQAAVVLGRLPAHREGALRYLEAVRDSVGADDALRALAARELRVLVEPVVSEPAAIAVAQDVAREAGYDVTQYTLVAERHDAAWLVVFTRNASGPASDAREHFAVRIADDAAIDVIVGQ